MLTCPSSVQVLPSPCDLTSSHGFIYYTYICIYVSTVFIPSQHFYNAILSDHCLLSPSTKISDISNLTCPKLNSPSPLKPMASVSPSQLTDFYPSSCSNKNPWIPLQLLFLTHPIFHSNPQYLESSHLFYLLLTQSWRSVALAALDLLLLCSRASRTGCKVKPYGVGRNQVASANEGKQTCMLNLRVPLLLTGPAAACMCKQFLNVIN